MEPADPQTAALYRLFQEAAHGGQAKVDALVALIQRTVFVAPWPAGVPGYRTLVNREGLAALPIFTERNQLEAAALRYGWLAPDGSAPAVEVGAREALHHARTQGLPFVVVDIAAEHSFEIAREEFEPLLTPAARRDSKGPFAASGRISSAVMQAVRPSAHRPGSSPGTLPAARPGSSAGMVPAAGPRAPSGSLPAAGPAPGSPAPGSPAPGSPAPGSPAPGSPAPVLAGAKLGPPPEAPSEDLLERLEAVLRGYPEVEWACLGGAPALALGLRVDPRIRQRVDEIAARAQAAAGRALAIVLLDDPAQMRVARADALVFYPWRRKG